VNKSVRVRYPKPDANQSPIFHELAQMVNGWQQVEDKHGMKYPAYTGALHGVSFIIFDRSRAGGLTLDTALYVGSVVLDIEIKQPGKREDLTAGEELYFRLSPLTGRVVTTSEEYFAIIQDTILSRL